MRPGFLGSFEPSRTPPSSATYLVATYSSSQNAGVWKFTNGSWQFLTALNPGFNNVRATGVSWANDSEYLAFGLAQLAGALSGPRIKIFKRSGDIFNELSYSNIDSYPTDAQSTIQCSFSPNGVYLAFTRGSSVSNNVLIYKRSGDTFTRLVDLSTSASTVAVSFSQDSNYLAVSLEASPWLALYKRVGDTFTPLTGPTPVFPPGNIVGPTYTPSQLSWAGSEYLAVVTFQGRPGILRKEADDSFVWLNQASPLVSTTFGMGAAFAPNSNYACFLSGSIPPGLPIYKRQGNSFTQLAGQPTTNITGGGQQRAALAFSPDSKFLAVSTSTANGSLRIYVRTEDTFTILPTLAGIEAGQAGGIPAFSPT